MGPKNKTKMIVLTGMKKAGKPAVLEEIIQSIPKVHSIAVIINELEEYSFNRERPEGGRIYFEEFIPECISCSYRVGIGTILRKVVKEHSPEVLIVNTPGVIDPQVLVNVVESIQEEYGICLCGELLAVYPPEFNRIYGKLPFTISQVRSATWVAFSSAFLKDPDCPPESEEDERALKSILDNASSQRRICKTPEEKEELLTDIIQVLLE